MTNPELSIVLPAYNEEDNIEKSIRAALALPLDCEVIVVDDGSLDKTTESSTNSKMQAPVRLVEHEFNKGYGAVEVI